MLSNSHLHLSILHELVTQLNICASFLVWKRQKCEFDFSNIKKKKKKPTLKDAELGYDFDTCSRINIIYLSTPVESHEQTCTHEFLLWPAEGVHLLHNIFFDTIYRASQESVNAF